MIILPFFFHVLIRLERNVFVKPDAQWKNKERSFYIAMANNRPLDACQSEQPFSERLCQQEND